ncbi:HNH endonuclease family protein [Gardnerella vaginalis]|uniref:HNH endonuclease family protein n=1 Tax=Gardnerella vaginalis TaxID=2702 RepID=UPI00177C217C|nr:HNH endonuclease family protein [Gardnerella vaginalis]MBE0296324.1 HNH endonuclease [Gardnerella vaginalis]
MQYDHNTHYSSNPISKRIASFIWLISLAIIIGIVIGLVLPKINHDVGEITGEYAAGGDAAALLNKLKVSKSHPSGYNRSVFGYRTTDVDKNGCDVREDVLARDLKQVRFKYSGSCKVASGLLHDPYTGLNINFVRGRKTSALVQIDHVVALENAWQSGAWKWSHAKRLKFGNDMLNLLAVQGAANQEKGSASAAYWLPSNKSFRCDYVARQIAVKYKYDLSVTNAEKRSMASILHGCSAQKLPNS